MNILKRCELKFPKKSQQNYHFLKNDRIFGETVNILKTLETYSKNCEHFYKKKEKKKKKGKRKMKETKTKKPDKNW